MKLGPRRGQHAVGTQAAQWKNKVECEEDEEHLESFVTLFNIQPVKAQVAVSTGRSKYSVQSK